MATYLATLEEVGTDVTISFDRWLYQPYGFAEYSFSGSFNTGTDALDLTVDGCSSTISFTRKVYSKSPHVAKLLAELSHS